MKKKKNKATGNDLFKLFHYDEMKNSDTKK